MTNTTLWQRHRVYRVLISMIVLIAALGCGGAGSVGEGADAAAQLDVGNDGNDVSVEASLSCAPRTMTCVGNIPVQCTSHGIQVRGAPCPFGCVAGMCSGECEAGTRTCDQNAPARCEAGFWTTEPVCPAACTEGRCEASCTPGRVQCARNRLLQLCLTEGTWDTSAVCPFLCLGGDCVGECTPGARGCALDGATPQVCGADGQWQQGERCPNVCTDGICEDGCTPGATTCSGATPLSCTADHVWSPGSSCPYVCADGACSGECKPGARRCDVDGRRVQVCDARGQWQVVTTCRFGCAATGGICATGTEVDAGSGGDAGGWCGDGVVGPDESCDPGPNPKLDCNYGQPSCTLCTATCRWGAGNPAYCGDGRVSDDEECDVGPVVDGNCPYGQRSCLVCTSACRWGAGRSSYCGDGVTNGGEACDNGSDPPQSCTYGRTSCTVCGASCQFEGGLASYCGDGVRNGAETDTDCGGASNACATRCDVGQACGVGSDCVTGVCESLTCALAPPILSLERATIKQLHFSWTASIGASYYKLLQDPTGASGYTQTGGNIASATLAGAVDIAVHRHNWPSARYAVAACDAQDRCVTSNAVGTASAMIEAIGYVKASNTGTSDGLGFPVALSSDGNTMVVGASGEASNATGINGNQADNSAAGSGAVYVFTRIGGVWSQQAYIKASNAGASDGFGTAVALSADGDTLAVGAPGEASNATGVNGNQADNSAASSGAVYVFARSGGVWSQQAYVKASNTGLGDHFGTSVALSANGNTLAVGAEMERSSATGINGNQADNSAFGAGAVYVFTRTTGVWTQQAYVKASNTGTSDHFGWSVALSGDGDTLAVGAYDEDSNATGINGNQADNSGGNAGAVYMFVRNAGIWSQQAYVKPSTSNPNAAFGVVVRLSADGNTLAVGATGEPSAATGVNGNQADNSAPNAGAVYVFTRTTGAWSQQAYIKASNTNANDIFGWAIAFSADGNTLAVGAQQEASRAVGVSGSQGDNSAADAGAVYVFTRSAGVWAQQAYVKASNTDASDAFGASVALSSDGSTLAVGASGESSNATGLGGNQANNSAFGAGAVYLY